jgi:hypothetical protein
MISKHDAQCIGCYRSIPANTEVAYRKGRGVRHLGGCQPISTEELAAGRARYAETEGRRLAEQQSRPDSFARHDAANESYRRAVRRSQDAEAGI